MSEHARLGLSNHRWPHCPASVAAEAAYEDVPSEAALDGTGTHLLLEMCLTKSAGRAEYYVNQYIGEEHPDKPQGWYVDQARCDRVQVCLDYVSERVQSLRSQDYIVSVTTETRSNPGAHYGRDDWWGTTDITIRAADRLANLKILEVIDYKDGRGWVAERDNTQLVGNLGGWMLANLHTLESVRMTIVQPKSSKPIRYQDTNPTYVKTILDGLARAAALTDAVNPEYVPDDKLGKGHCEWCKHRHNCVALAKKQGEALMDNDMSLIPLLDLSSLGTVSSDELVKVALKQKAAENFFKKVYEELQKRVEGGEEIEGCTMASVSSKKVWSVSEEEVRKALKNRKVPVAQVDIVTLISPAQALKLECLTPQQKKDLEAKYISTVMGDEKLVIKPHSVTVEKKKPSVVEMFGGVPAAPLAAPLDAMPSFE